MGEVSMLQILGFGALAVLVVAWLVVSFQRPGAARSRTAWVAALSMYLAFVALFGSLFLRARAADSTAGQIGFGFLLGIFLAGSVVSLARTLSAFFKAGAGSGHSTH